MVKILLVCHVNYNIGIGHLSRLLVLANQLKKENKIIPEFLIFGELVKKEKLEGFKVYKNSSKDNFNNTIKNIIELNSIDLVAFDINQNYVNGNFRSLLSELKIKKIKLISIDSLIDYCDVFDIIWIPSFNFNLNKYNKCKSLIRFGWNSYLIKKNLKTKTWKPGSNVLVLTGGSDPMKLGKIFPTKIDNILNKNVNINWVRGPLSKEPIIPTNSMLNWSVHREIQQLDQLIIDSNYVISIFGVSFFEVLQYGLPTIVFSPFKNHKKDLDALSKEKVAIVANNSCDAVHQLNDLMNNNELAKQLSLNSKKKFRVPAQVGYLKKYTHC